MGTLGRYICITVLMISAALNGQAQNKDSLWQIWKNPVAKDSARINALDHLCFLLHLESKLDSVLLLADLAVDFTEKHQLEKQHIRALLRKADAYGEAYKDRLKAFELYQQCYRLSRKANYDNGMGASLNNLGTIYLNWGDLSNAIHYYYEGLKIIERRGDPVQWAAALSNIADIYSHAGNLDSAVLISKKALPAAKTDNRVYASILRCLGGIYRAHKNYDSAHHYLTLAVQHAEKNKDLFSLRHSFFEITLNYLDQHDLVNARRYLSKSLHLHEQAQDSVYIGKCMATDALLSYQEGQKQQAIGKAKKALIVLSKNIDKRDQLELMKELSAWYFEQRDYKSAYHFREASSRLQDSLGNTDADNALVLEQLKYSAEKKRILEKAATEKRLSQVREEAEKKGLKKTIWLVVVSAVLLLLCVLAWFRYHHYKQKTIIANQHNKIIKQQLLTAQMNPHFIFNSLNAIQNFICKQDSYQAGIYLKQFSDLIRMILNFSTKEHISLQEEAEFLKAYLNLQQVRFNEKFLYELKIDPAIDLENTLIAPMIAQPFLENAIEHGLAHKPTTEPGLLSISIRIENKKLLYEIEDNGIGLNKSVRLYEQREKKHQSLAITITKERLKQMNDKLPGSYALEIHDKSQLNAASSGVHVKFVTPFLIA